jgi:hypothetical protein
MLTETLPEISLPADQQDNTYHISLIASAVRVQLYNLFLKSLEGTTVKVEVVFAGNRPPECELYSPDNVSFKYIKTANIKPAQCYEIARRAATGEVIVWVADDCEFPNDVIGKAYRYWKNKHDEKIVLSIQTKETGYNVPQCALFDMNVHRFFGGRINTPLMAPLGMISRKFLQEIGGFDRRYICGQYENDVVMRVIGVGGFVRIFGGPDCFIDIDHLGKSWLIGESSNNDDFLNRPFAKGYPQDRAILESSWADGFNRVLQERRDAFKPYDGRDILTKTQSNTISPWL